MTHPIQSPSGNMMTQPLIISDLLEYAAAHHGQQEIISRRLEGDIHRYNYREALQRSKQLAVALQQLGVQPGDRIATLAWNTYRHFECYYGISGIGAICHTVNPRLYREQIEYIINHAEDSYVFLDACFAQLLEPIAAQLPSVKGFILLIDEDQMPSTTLPNVSCYETLINQPDVTAAVQQFNWPRLAQDAAACLCYTSGTTGNPKGVLYSHGSTVLHAYASRNPDALNISADSVVMPVVPMYHVCAWGMPYIAPMAGATLVLPGEGMDGKSLHQLIELADIDLMLGVPTVWLGLIDYLKRNQLRIDSVKTVGVGGSASPRSLVETLDKEYGVYLLPIWGMTETSPLATLGAPTKAMQTMSDDERYRLQTTAGKPMFGIELEIFDDNDQPVAHDGESRGYLRVRGPWV
ncbi:MAG: AMP-binding protein, partial [Pseudomonadota bacterium]